MKSSTIFPCEVPFLASRPLEWPALVCVLLTLLVVPTATATAAGHDGVRCAACHQSGGFGGREVLRTADPVCLDCHGTGPVHRDLGMQVSTDSGCTGCHSFHDRDESATSAPVSDDAVVPAGASASQDHCITCHTEEGGLGNLSPGHRVAADLYHRYAGSLAGTRPSEICLRCHGQGTGSGWADRVEGEVIRLNRHASHPFGMEVRPGAGGAAMPIRAVVDSRIPLFDRRMECSSCHRLTSPVQDLLVPFAEKYDLCLGCHEDGHDESVDPGQPPIAWAGVGP